MRALLTFTIALLCACTATKSTFNPNPAPPAPDYFDPLNWAALPTKADPADRVPLDTMKNNEAEAPVDVFFLHPTTYTAKRGDKPWNASTFDTKLNAQTDNYPILYQASLFNAAGKVYAPRYRQAHLDAYYTKDTMAAKAAFEMAYSDIKRAFEHYLRHYNKNRPIIIASHSQGTTHAKQLLREFFDGKPLQKQLVAAYVVGIPVEVDYFTNIKPCNSVDDIGCFVAWRSYLKDHYPKWHKPGEKIVVTNPLTWSLDTTYAAKTLNTGGVLLKFNEIVPQVADAQIHDGFLWLTKPKFPGSFFWRNPNYHAGDYNLFYTNVRYNAVQRVQVFLEQK